MQGKTLVLGMRDVGLFSNFNAVLNHLRFSLGRFGIEAIVVDWQIPRGGKQSPYGHPGDGNLWLKLFAPLPFDHFPEQRLTHSTFVEFNLTGSEAYTLDLTDPDWREAYFALFQRYIRVRPEIAARVDETLSSCGPDEALLGVHYRHPAHSVENPFPLPPPDVFAGKTAALVPRGRPWRVVLATDTQSAVETFRAAFGERLVVQPGVGRQSHHSNDRQFHQQNKHSSVELARQVLVDCLLLARCDLLLHAVSNVATAAGYMNPRMNMRFWKSVDPA